MAATTIDEPSGSQDRGLYVAAVLAKEQLRYAMQIAQELAPAGHTPDPAIVASLVQAMATNYQTVK